MLAENFNVGATIEYACDEGHLLVGPTARVCLDTGFYNEFPPVCKRIQCGYPADIANGEYTLVNDSVGYLSRVVYACEEGYEMVGRAQLACDIDERWNGPPPRCERKKGLSLVEEMGKHTDSVLLESSSCYTTSSFSAVQCTPPTEIPNGFVEVANNSTVFGTKVKYTCESGHQLIGPSVLTCLASGQYDAVPPTCLGK